MDHYEDPFDREPVERATHAAEGENRVCGDSIRIELRIDDDGRVAQAGFDGEGCVISQASASMLMEHIADWHDDQLKDFSANDMLDLFGPRLSAERQKCCLLPWRIMQTARQTSVANVDDVDDDADDPNFGGPSLSEEC